MSRRAYSGGTIYFARGLDTGRIKIGCSVNVDGRLQAHALTEPMELLAVLRGTYADERALHDRFAALRADTRRHGSREWFNDDGSIAAFIATLPAHRRGSIVYRTTGRVGQPPGPRTVKVTPEMRRARTYNPFVGSGRENRAHSDDPTGPVPVRGETQAA